MLANKRTTTTTTATTVQFSTVVMFHAVL